MTSGVRTTRHGDTVALNVDSSMITGAATGDVHINRLIWEGWINEFDNHAVFGEGTGTIHRFYNNAPGRTTEEMSQAGVIAPFGEPSVEIQGNVLVDTEQDSSTTLIEAGNAATVQLTNIMLNSSTSTGDVTNVNCVTSSGTTTGWGPPTARWALLQDFITQNPDQTPTTRAEITQWLGWDQIGCRAPTRHVTWSDDPVVMPEKRRRQIERKNRRNTAELRAEQLLWNVLDRQQRREWRTHGYFHFQVGPRTYRIEVRRRSGNVHLLDEAGEISRSYCCHTKDHVPNADNALAQMMMLHHDEEGFLALANVSFDRDRRGGVTVGNAGVIYYPGEQAAA